MCIIYELITLEFQNEHDLEHKECTDNFNSIKTR